LIYTSRLEVESAIIWAQVEKAPFAIKEKKRNFRHIINEVISELARLSNLNYISKVVVNHL